MQAEQILVVDDEPEMRAALTHALSRNGYQVKCASCGTEALLNIKKEEFSMVITDVKMPRMSGLQVLKEVKKISPQVPVIMMTGYGTIGNAVEAMQNGASDYILKPFSCEVLESTINKINTITGNKPDGRSKVICSSTGKKTKHLITRDPALINILKLAKNIAPSKATVLIQGESGTGKEILASYIHNHSSSKKSPYVAVNCAALPDTLAESELFGHEKGSFTGAVKKNIGKFELADTGTIVLDEISEMPMPLQSKLLRVLQEKEIDRVGGRKPVQINTRVIAISNIDLQKAVGDGKFREDLFYRINVIPFVIPPLRDRKDDIPLLANHFLKKYSLLNNKRILKITDEAVSRLLQYDWKGNVRELENTMERTVLFSNNDIILAEHLFLDEAAGRSNNRIPVKAGISVRQMEKKLIYKTLKEANGNKTHASKILGISIRTLRNKLNEYKAEPALDVTLPCSSF